MTDSSPSRILVTGATGKTGRRVADLLEGAGRTVRRASRPRFDWSDPATWPGTVDGCDAAYLAYAPDLAMPGAPETLVAFAEVAAAAGVRRFVLLSGRGESEAQRAEALLGDVAVRHGADASVLRAAFFWQNFTEGLFAPGIEAGRLRFIADDVREPFVDADDLAEAAVALLVGHAPAGVHEVTGPRLLTFADAAREVGAGLGVRVHYERVDGGAMTDDLVAVGLHPEEAAGVVTLFETVLDGRNEHLADGVQQVLGRPARALPRIDAEVAR